MLNYKAFLKNLIIIIRESECIHLLFYLNLTWTQLIVHPLFHRDCSDSKYRYGICQYSICHQKLDNLCGTEGVIILLCYFLGPYIYLFINTHEMLSYNDKIKTYLYWYLIFYFRYHMVEEMLKHFTQISRKKKVKNRLGG